MSSARAASAIKEVINFKNAKRISFLLMIIVSIYHGFLMTKSGGNLCKSLLSDGRSGPDGEFRPYSCMIHTYLSRDSHKCFKRLAPWGDVVRLYFVGDSRLKKLFKAFVYHINDGATGENFTSKMSVTDDSQYVTGEVDLRFFHHDEITDDTLNLFKSWSGSTNLSSVTESNIDGNKMNHVSTPTHLVISMGTKTIQRYNQSEDGLLEYMNGVKRLTGVLDELKFARSVWMLQDPVAESLLSKELKFVTNDLIDKYNEVASRAMKYVTGVEIWSSNRLIALEVGFPTINWNCRRLQTLSTSINNFDKMTAVTSSLEYKNNTSGNVCLEMPMLSDGYHVSDKAMKENVQILLNLYCNNQMKFSDGTCCRGSEPITPVQEKCFIFYAICVLSTFLCFLYSQFVSHGVQLKNFRKFLLSLFRKTTESSQLYIPIENNSDADDDHVDNDDSHNNCSNDNNDTSSSFFIEFYELSSALSKFGAIMMYFFICDRTILFMKANKGYTNMSFILPIIYCFVLGLFFSGPTKRTKVNHLDITREWKGWMQLYLLIYHFTDSYRVTPIFMSARLVVSSYLFLSGFGHFCYFWRKPVAQISWLKLLNYRRFSREFCTAWKAFWQILHRYLIVIYRFNFFVFGLCLVMNRGYLAYYFIPLISFWFTVVLIVCVLFPRVSGQQISGRKTKQNDNNDNNNGGNNNSNNNHPGHANHINTNTTTGETTQMTTTSSTTATTISNFVNGTTNINYNSRGFLPNNNVYDDDYSNHHPLQQYFTTANNECLPNQYTESDDEVYFSQSPMKSKFNLKSSLLPLPSSSSSLPKSRNVVINDHFDSIPHSSTSFSSISYKGHQKALSLGTGFDLCQNYSNAVTIDNSNHDNSTLFPSYEMNKKLTGHRLHRSVVKSRGRLGPPLTEDLMRKFQCITVPLKKQTESMHKKKIMIMNQKLKQPIESSKSWIYRFHSKLYVHCSRIRLVYLIMILKFTVLICFIEILYRSRGCFNWLFFSGPQKYLFQYNHEHTTNVPAHEEIADDQQTWFYRWSMDRFSAVYGMIFALLCESLRQTGVLKDTEDDHLECLLPLHNNNNNSNNYNVNNRNFTIVESDHEKRMKTQNNSADYTSSYHGSSNLLFSRSDEFLNQLFTPDDSLYEINKKYKRTVNSSIQYSNHHMEQEEREIRNDDEGLNTVNLPLLKPTTHDKDYVENSYLLREFLCKCFSPLGLTVLGIIGLMFAFIYVFACSNRETCLHIHAYVCLIPILSYILVRNSFSSLRRTYSIFFAWIGDMSLELFIAQYHIWLSADAYGILVLLPGYPLINLAVTSFIFICICHEVHILTRRLQKYVIPNSPLKLVRNVLIFTLVFHLITNSTSQMIQWDFL